MRKVFWQNQEKTNNKYTNKQVKDVFFKDETIWLNQAQICDVFQKSKSTISTTSIDYDPKDEKTILN